MKSRLAIVLTVMACAMTAYAAKEDWKIGVQCYSFRKITFLETVDLCSSMGVHYLEIYPNQKIGGDFTSTTSQAMTSDERQELLKILKQRDMTLLSFGCTKGNSEKSWREIFQFCKEMGIQNIISEPAQDQMAIVDRLTEEYGVGVGIHNHKTPTPDDVEALLKGITHKVGIAPDNGHWTRYGHDNLASLKRFEGRIRSIHLKDMSASKEQVPYGAGIVDIPGILAYLDASDYKGPLIIEYEAGNPETAVKQCSDYLNAFITGNAHRAVAAAAEPAAVKKPEVEAAPVVAPAKEWESVGISDLDRVWCNYDKSKPGPCYAERTFPPPKAEPSKKGSETVDQKQE